MKTYTICGSMRFAKEMQQIAYELVTQKGYDILQCIYSGTRTPTEQEYKNIQTAHFHRIDISDGIYVVNIGGYVGEATLKEIEYAKIHNKEIVYHEQQETETQN